MATYEKIQKVKIGKMGQECRQTVLTTAAEGYCKSIEKNNSIIVDNMSCGVYMKQKWESNARDRNGIASDSKHHFWLLKARAPKI